MKLLKSPLVCHSMTFKKIKLLCTFEKPDLCQATCVHQNNSVPSGLSVHVFFLRARAASYFLLGTVVTPWGNCQSVLEHIKSIKAMTNGLGGNRLGCLLGVSGLLAD